MMLVVAAFPELFPLLRHPNPMLDSARSLFDLQKSCAECSERLVRDLTAQSLCALLSRAALGVMRREV